MEPDANINPCEVLQFRFEQKSFCSSTIRRLIDIRQIT
jgi:hypothetical protein